MKKKIQRYLKRLIRGWFERINVNNRTFVLPGVIPEATYRFSMNEWWMIDLFSIINITEGTFIDVGANTGQTLLKLRAVSNISYVGFEPNFNCVGYLHRLVSINNLENVTIIPVALSQNSEIKKLFSYSDSWDSSASVITNFRETQTKVEWYVPSFNFETVNSVLKIKKVSVIKIDVEGAELEVLQGFEINILKNRPLVIIEILPVYDKGNKQRYFRQKEIENLIKKWDYEIFRIIKSRKKIIRFDSVNEIGIHSNLEMCDYLLKPKENKINL